MNKLDTKDAIVRSFDRALGPIRESIGLTPKSRCVQEDVDEIVEWIKKIPVTGDGVRRIPGGPGQSIWINPTDYGWMGNDDERMRYITWDADDNEIYHGPVEVKHWAYFGCHMWIRVEGDGPGEEEGHHWDGLFYSSYDAALNAMSSKDREKVKLCTTH